MRSWVLAFPSTPSTPTPQARLLLYRNPSAGLARIRSTRSCAGQHASNTAITVRARVMGKDHQRIQSHSHRASTTTTIDTESKEIALAAEIHSGTTAQWPG